jgi:hypothetical protein
MITKKEVIILNSNQIYCIVKRFYSKFKLRRNTKCVNPNILSNDTNNIDYIKSYKFLCIYSDTKNITRENLVLKYKYKYTDEIYCLNIPLDQYQDLL